MNKTKTKGGGNPFIAQIGMIKGNLLDGLNESIVEYITTK